MKRLSLLLVFGLFGAGAYAQSAPIVTGNGNFFSPIVQNLDKAVAFLKSAQGADGSFSPKLAGPGVTAIVAAGLIKCGVSPDDPLVAKSLTFIESNARSLG